ncbi:MAG: S-adenosylmethionine:tRNA ribosyltransferase-isomerase, partial [Proteobacteria bacterium]|nr:S-adenosylmethionine:tRNA ribosyltransferase-isomerase [Pseudomonadota bacterium]
MSYLISDYKYELPKRLIANEPVQPRDHSRMLILDKAQPQLRHKSFLDFPEQLEKGSLLIVNNSKVIP